MSSGCAGRLPATPAASFLLIVQEPGYLPITGKRHGA
jgi:hypothetical protein